MFTASDQRALRAVAVQFFVNGALFASFIPRLPEIRDRVDISVAEVGLLLSIAGVSGLVGSAVVGPAVSRFGTRQVMLAAGALTALSLPVIGIARTPLVLLVGLIALQTFDVLMDVAMNMQGSWLSARRHTPVMTRLHGLWSLGTLIGGVSASRIAASGISVSTHLICAAAILLMALGFASRGLLRIDEHPGSDATGAAKRGSAAKRRISPVLSAFLLVGFFSIALESTAIDWAAFRLVDDFAASTGVAALGYVAVAAGMTGGRFSGDFIAARVGGTRLLSMSIVITGVGLAAATLSPGQNLTLIGYAVAGLGVANLSPILYDTAAQHPGRPGAGLGALTGGLRTANLTVPLLVGTLAASRLSVGSAIAIVTLPSVIGFLAMSAVISRLRRGALGS